MRIKKISNASAGLEDSNSGLVHWIIDDSTEANVDDVFYVDKLLDGLTAKNTQNLTFMTVKLVLSTQTQYVENKNNTV